MAREEFINSLREASRWVTPPTSKSEMGARRNSETSSILHSSNFWLTPFFVKGFDSADFMDLSNSEREKLEREVATFLEVVDKVKDKPATKALSEKARKHLESAITIVRKPILNEWLHAQQRMLEEAKTAAKSNGWFVDEDEKEMSESLLGSYKAPRLRIRTPDQEVVFDPVACFGSGRQGVIDLVTMPTYETAYFITLKNDKWWIASANKTSLHHKPFSQESLVHAIRKLSQR